MLSARDLRLLDHLVLGAGPASAAAAGLRRARQAGQGREFHEYRRYEPGDDPRSIDWTLKARLDQLVVRVSRADARARLHVLVDASASMRVGGKLACARTIAAVLCYVAAEGGDAAGLAIFRDAVLTMVAPSAGRAQALRLLALLDSTDAAGRSAIDRALVSYSAAAREPGLAVIVSDFFDPVCTLDGVRALQHRGFTPALVQVVAPDEIDPPIDGLTALFDVEDPDAAPIVVDAACLEDYQTRVAARADQLRTFCAVHGLPWLQVVSTSTCADLVPALGRAGFLREGG